MRPGCTAAASLFCPLLLALVVLGGISPPHSPEDGDGVCPPEPFLSDLFVHGLNLSWPALQPAAAAWAAGRNATACAALAAYYRIAHTAPWLRPTGPPAAPSGRSAGGEADEVLADRYNFYGTTASVPRFPGPGPSGSDSGGLNWSYCPPPLDDPQWMLALNRHGQLPTLAAAWFGTGNLAYSSFLDRMITDWVAYSGAAPSKPPTGGIACNRRPPDWLTLDTGIRLGSPWPETFFMAQAADEFSVPTRLLMLASTWQSATYLRNHQSTTANWEATQLHAIVQTALAFPEFRSSAEWLSFGVGAMEQLLHGAIYPDGVSSEQTTHYDLVALKAFDSLLELLRAANATFDDSYAVAVEVMYNFIAYEMDPDGLAILNGDSDLDNVTALVLAAADRFQRPDWVYIATRGQAGSAPPATPTVMFPWAGQFVMRNTFAGSNQNMTWSWFDVGPFGSSGHAHRDKLHISMRAFGAHLLVDSGRFSCVMQSRVQCMHVVSTCRRFFEP